MHFDLLELHVRDKIFPLTLMEANLLRYLILHEGRPISRKAMLEEVWGLHEDTDTRAIDNRFVVRLRRYIGEDERRCVRATYSTVRGVGVPVCGVAASGEVERRCAGRAHVRFAV